jgi:O-antigen/teichoic acid export membrane protein
MQHLIKNITANVLQTILSGSLLFILYAYVSRVLGIDQLGLWSVIIASISISRLADLGLNSGITRFVSKYLALNLKDTAIQIIGTSLIILFCITTLLLPILYEAIKLLLPYIFDRNSIEQALSILPYSLLSLWLTIPGSLMQSSLDGCHRIDLRARIFIIGQLLMVIISFFLIPKYGIISLAYSQVIQSLFVLIASSFALFKILPGFHLISLRIEKSLIKEIFLYSANTQAANIFILLLDPITKIILAKYSGVTSVGYFEIANQVAQKLRSLVVSANQAIVPKLSHLNEVAKNEMTKIFKVTFSSTLYMALFLCSIIIGFSEIISLFFVGSINKEFIFILNVISLGWFLNLAFSPIYFQNIATGYLESNTSAHFYMGLSNALLGYMFARIYSIKGAVIIYSFSLIIGGLILFFNFYGRNKAYFKGLNLDKYRYIILACSLMILSGALFRIEGFNSQSLISIALRFFIFTFMIHHIFLNNPLKSFKIS